MKDVLYPQTRALEHAADLPGVRPLRIYRIGFPLYEVEIEAYIHERQPYEVIDRFVGRAIAQAELRSVPEIADFLGLSETLVDRAVRFLANSGHLESRADGGLALGPLGTRSVQDDARYVPKHDRQKLYFDGVRSQPMPEEYYRKGITVLDRELAAEERGFRLLQPASSFRADAVHALVARQDRDAFNVPAELRDVQVVSVDAAYLPCYVIRTRTPRGLEFLAYSAVTRLHDEYLEDICRGWSLINGVLSMDDADRSTDPRDEFGDWLRRQNLRPDFVWTDEPPRLRLQVPASRFRDGRPSGDGLFGLTQVGAFVAPRGQVLQLWCHDPKLRRKAAYERAMAFATASQGRTASEVGDRLGRLCGQLEIPEISLSDLRDHARRKGYDLP